MIASFTSICDAKRWIIQRKIINLSKQFFRPAGRPRVFTQPRLFPSETSSPNGSLWSMDQKPGFDIIGDVHGHAALLEKLLRKLGYVKYGKTWGHPDGRIAVFTGDLINRGPEQVETVKLVRRMVRHETAYCVAGNHEYAALCRFCGIGHVHGTDSRITFFDSAVKDPKTLQKLMKWTRTRSSRYSTPVSGKARFRHSDSMRMFCGVRERSQMPDSLSSRRLIRRLRGLRSGFQRHFHTKTRKAKR